MRDLNKSILDIEAEFSQYWVKEPTETPKVSVIIPVYNVELFVKDCLASLIKQTLKEIEIIVVNDGSKDNSEKIVQEFCKHDSRIKLINQENAGQAAARNRGISNAKAEYISFIDSDDWIDENFLEKLYLSATNNNCDIAAATIIRKGEHFQKHRVYYTEEKIVESLEDKIKTVLNTDGAILCEVMVEKEYAFIPKLSARKLNDGTMISPSLEDMYPFLDKEEFENNIIK